MTSDFLNNLPSEIMAEIFSRLPVQAVARSKCVCKPWLHLLRSNEFVKSHLAKPVPGLAVMLIGLYYQNYQVSCSIFELKEGYDVDLDSHNFLYNEVTKFGFPFEAEIRGSANGLLFLFKEYKVHLVCNPITRDYIKVRFATELTRPRAATVYGFGVSKRSGQYKVVGISYHDNVVIRGGRRIIPESDCHVYTLGTGLWRRVEVEARFVNSFYGSCVFYNGNLHWVAVSDSDINKFWISCFDLETERFSHFATPVPFREAFGDVPGFSVLGDCLCLCDNHPDMTVSIWLMKEYGVEKSWIEEYVISSRYIPRGIIYSIKLSKDGDVLMFHKRFGLFCYSRKTRRIRTWKDIGSFKEGVNAILLTPSFVSLKSFGNENVISF